MERKEKYAVLPAPTQQKDADVQENLKQFGSNVQNALKDFQPVKISISDNEGESFNLAADDSVKSQVESIAKTLKNCFRLWESKKMEASTSIPCYKLQRS